MTLKIGALTAKLGLFFSVVCFIYMFNQTLADQLYRDKGLIETRLIRRGAIDTMLPSNGQSSHSFKSVVTKLDTLKSGYREKTGTEWLVLGLG